MTQPRINLNQIRDILSGKVIVEEFSEESSYKSNVILVHDGILYMSLEFIEPGPFNEEQYIKIGSTNWGEIGGNIQDQTDLMNLFQSSKIKGGWHEVATLADRDLIPTDRLELGMSVYVIATGKAYICTSINPNDWEEFMTESLVISDYTEDE